MQNSAHVVIFNDRDEIFLIKRNDFPVWNLTGGGVENGENPVQAALRECKEESAFNIQISDLKLHYIYHSKRATKHGYVFKGQYLNGEYKPEFPGNIGRWFSLNKLPLSMTRSTKRMILDLMKYKNSPHPVEINWNLNSFNDLHILFLHPVSVIKYLLKLSF